MYEPIGKHDRLLRATITVLVPEHQQPVGGMTGVALGWKMRVALDHEHPAGMIHIQSGGRDDIRIGSKQFNHQSGITTLWQRVGGGRIAGQHGNGQQQDRE